MFAAVGEAQLGADDEVADGAGGRISPACARPMTRAARWTGDSGDVVGGAFDFAGVPSGANVEAEVARVADDLCCAAHPDRRRRCRVLVPCGSC